MKNLSPSVSSRASRETMRIRSLQLDYKPVLFHARILCSVEKMIAALQAQSLRHLAPFGG